MLFESVEIGYDVNISDEEWSFFEYYEVIM